MTTRLFMATCVAVIMCGSVARGETYVADVDAIETDLTQYFNTGLALDGDIKVEMEFQWMELPSTGYAMLFGVADKELDKYFGLRVWAPASGSPYYHAWYGGGHDIAVYPQVGERQAVTCVFEDGNQTISLNGNTIMTDTKPTAIINSDYKITLLAINKSNSIEYKAAVRLYSAKIWKKNAGVWQLVRDYKPVLALLSDGASYVGALKDDTQGVVLASAGKAARPVMETVDDTPDEILHWVETDGRQFVDTGVQVDGTISFTADFAWLEVGSANGNERTFLGATTGTDGRCYMLHSINEGGTARLWIGYGASTGRPVNDGNQLIMRVFQRLCVSGSFGAGSQTLSENGKTYTISSPRSTVLTLNKYVPIHLFGTDSDDATYGSRIRLRSSVRFYSLDMATNGVPVRSFRPCLKNGKVALYDSVNGRIHYSPVAFSAYGKLNERPQNHVEYVETSGAQHIDTGVIGKNGTRCELDVAFPKNDSTNGDGTVIGSVTNSSWHGIMPLRQAYSSDYPGEYFYFRYKYGSTYYSPQYAGTTTPAEAIGKWLLVKKNERHRITVDLEAGSQDISIDGNCFYWQSGEGYKQADGTGTRVLTGSKNAAGFDTGRSMYLFALRNANGSATSFSHVRFYGARIWQKDAGGVYRLLREYCPVKLRSGEVVLWDKCSETYESVCWSATGPVTTKFNPGCIISFR